MGDIVSEITRLESAKSNLSAWLINKNMSMPNNAKIDDLVEVLGDMADNGAMNKTFDGLTATSTSIPAGYTSGGTVSLTDDIKNALSGLSGNTETSIADGLDNADEAVNTTQAGLIAQCIAALNGKSGGGGANLEPFTSATCGTYVPSASSASLTLTGLSSCKMFAMRCTTNDGNYFPSGLHIRDAVMVDTGTIHGKVLTYCYFEPYMEDVSSHVKKIKTITDDTITFTSASLLQGYSYEYIVLF